jgi:ADP-ribose pyrophosphatase
VAGRGRAAHSQLEIRLEVSAREYQNLVSMRFLTKALPYFTISRFLALGRAYFDYLPHDTRQIDSLVEQISISSRTSVFKTPWVQLVEKIVTEGGLSPHYSLTTRDYVSIFAVTTDGKFPLVSQFRPAVEMITLEIPGGYIEEGQTPEEAARKELLEETGFMAKELISLGVLAPDTGRLDNRMWSFFAPRVVGSRADAFQAEPSVKPVLYDKPLRNLVLSESAFCCALNRATILAAVAQGYIDL